MPSFLPNLSPLRSREFRLIYLGQFVSGFGSSLTYVVIPFQIYALTNSTLAVGFIGMVEFISILSVALLGGRAGMERLTPESASRTRLDCLRIDGGSVRDS